MMLHVLPIDESGGGDEQAGRDGYRRGQDSRRLAPILPQRPPRERSPRRHGAPPSHRRRRLRLRRRRRRFCVLSPCRAQSSEGGGRLVGPVARRKPRKRGHDSAMEFFTFLGSSLPPSCLPLLVHACVCVQGYARSCWVVCVEGHAGVSGVRVSE
jgi:hypothetical protein